MVKDRPASRAWESAALLALRVCLWVPMGLLFLAASAAWAGAPIQITSVPNPSIQLQINAYGGAKHGTTLKVVSNCPAGNTDCTWTLLPNGMIVSDTDRTLAWNAYGGAAHGANVTLVNNCRPDITDCTWTVRDDGLIVSNTNPQLAVNAYGGVVHEAPLKLVNNCAPQLDGCKWLTARALYSAETNNAFAVNAYGGAKHGTELQVVQNCPADNSDCLWLFQSDGMILSGTSTGLAWNAYGGAKVGTKVTLVVGCPASNSDCQWDLRPDGLIVSRTNPTLAVKVQGGPHHIAPLVLADDCTPAIAGCKWATVPFSRPSTSTEVWGFADLHTHPASHLAFGADANGDNGIFHGKPGLKLTDVQSTIYNDLAVCLPDNHSSSTTDLVQDLTRKKIITIVDEMGGMSHEAHGARGAPDFKNWPAALSISHQQMHISDIRRAFDGGLRLLVASVTNNQLLHLMWHNGVGKYPDESSLKPNADFDFKAAIEQINFIKTLVSSNADWMEIVLTPQQARAAIQNGKLAVVLGLEMDTLTLGQILTLVKNHGVRSVIPIHLADNSFGGAAVYSDAFNTLTRFLNDKWFDVDTDPKLSFRLSNEQKRLISVAGPHLGKHQVGQLTIDLGDPEGLLSANLKKETVNYPVGPGGHQNRIGLLGNGDAFVQLMRNGILLDLAHMGEKSIDKALEYGELYSYPLMDSHTGLRNDIGGHSERDLSYAQAERIQRLGGVIGLGVMGDSDSTCDLPRLNQCFIEAENKRMWCEDEGKPACKPGETLARSNCRKTFCRDRPSLSQWLNKYDGALSRLGNRGVALGTDANGFSPLFPPGSEGVVHYPFAVAREYSPPPAVVGSMGNRQIGSRVYSFDTDGMATFGMIPDFLEALNNLTRVC